MGCHYQKRHKTKDGQISGDIMADTVSLPTHDKLVDAPRLGGWLFLPALHLVVSPVIFFAAASTTNDTITTLAHNGRLGESSQADVFQIVTWGLPAVYLILTIVAGVHFFRRSQTAPRIMQVWYAAGFIISIIPLPYMASLLGIEFDSSQLGRSIVWTVFWVIYFSKSKRVKRTFVEDIGNRYLYSQRSELQR